VHNNLIVHCIFKENIKRQQEETEKLKRKLKTEKPTDRTHLEVKDKRQMRRSIKKKKQFMRSLSTAPNPANEN